MTVEIDTIFVTISAAKVDVSLPEELIDRIEERIDHLEFESSEDYISYLLEEVLYHVEESNDLSESKSIDDQQIEDRLKSLGYLND
jgi:Arc/MetJ-type ribon-helix-helix transcriptional regulator